MLAAWTLFNSLSLSLSLSENFYIILNIQAEARNPICWTVNSDGSTINCQNTPRHGSDYLRVVLALLRLPQQPTSNRVDKVLAQCKAWGGFLLGKAKIICKAVVNPEMWHTQHRLVTMILNSQAGRSCGQGRSMRACAPGPGVGCT